MRHEALQNELHKALSLDEKDIIKEAEDFRFELYERARGLINKMWFDSKSEEEIDAMITEEFNVDEHETVQRAFSDVRSSMPRCCKCNSVEADKRHPQGVYAGTYCDNCWKDSGYNEDLTISDLEEGGETYWEDE